MLQILRYFVTKLLTKWPIVLHFVPQKCAFEATKLKLPSPVESEGQSNPNGPLIYIHKLVRNSFTMNIPDNGCYRNTTKFPVNQLFPQKCGY